MSRDGSRVRRRLAVVASSLFAVAFAAMLAAQLSLMSFLDTGRARTVADEVARSAFVTGLVDDAIRNAVAPLAGDDVARQVAATASTDPRVRGVVRSALVSGHRQLVDPDAPAGAGSPQVDAVVGGVVDDIGEQYGVDLTGVADQVQIPGARPDRLPAVGLRDLALVTRAIAGLVAVAAALACVLVHPRPALGVAAIGARAAIVCGGWAVTLLVVGWVIGRVADTLLGELLDAIW
ncbi:MAG: hypothetical protein WD225_09550, partial [Ilumatobacteraceae bacterium]